MTEKSPSSGVGIPPVRINEEITNPITITLPTGEIASQYTHAEFISGHIGVDESTDAAHVTPDHWVTSDPPDMPKTSNNSQVSLPNESSINLPVLKVFDDDIEVEYGFSLSQTETSASELIQAGLNRVDHGIQTAQDRVDALDQEIDRLTNHADALDYQVAVGSGLLAGLIDIFWVGEFSLDRGKAWSNKTVNEFVMKIAKQQGYKGERLDGAIRTLENKFPVSHDNNWNGKSMGISAKSHHLDDLAHHPTPIGLFFSILTQFTMDGYFQNKEGTFLPITIDEDAQKNPRLIGQDIPSKLLCGTVNWFFHLVSDMSGSNKTAGTGMGIPGPIVSMLKELSTIPGLNKTGLPKKIHEIFVKEKFDLRSEMGVLHELGRQAVPVLINEVLVRAFYFIRRLITEIKTKRSFAEIDWKKTLPWNNRTMTRMLTIATGTFTAVDLADAAIRAGLKSGSVEPVTFTAQLLLRVNFVGIGRFTVAVYSDVSMGMKRERLRDERIDVLNQQLHLANAKIAYLQGGVWLAAERTEICLQEAEQMMYQSAAIFVSAWEANRESLYRIGQLHTKIQAKNPQLIDDIQYILKWS